MKHNREAREYNGESRRITERLEIEHEKEEKIKDDILQSMIKNNSMIKQSRGAYVQLDNGQVIKISIDIVKEDFAKRLFNDESETKKAKEIEERNKLRLQEALERQERVIEREEHEKLLLQKAMAEIDKSNQ